MDKQMLNSIREAEKSSHIEIYSSKKLFESGSWLQKPVKTVTDLLTCFENRKNLKALDLGCGVGRNCIAIAQKFKSKCRIDCVDILEFDIKELTKYSIEYNVKNEINGITSSIDDYRISENEYDLILAVSALEHTDSSESFKNKIVEINKGIKSSGIVCLIVNSEITEKNKESGESLIPQFEVNFKTDELLELLSNSFSGWEILKQSISTQRYDIPRESCVSDLTTNVVTFVAKKP